MTDALQQHEHTLRGAKHIADAVAAVGVVGTLAGYLPLVAAFLGCIWYCLQIYWAVSDRAARKRSLRQRKTD